MDISQLEHYTYDLTGNRLRLDRDLGNDGNSNDPNSDFDSVITYDDDVNDRLITELFDDKTTANADTRAEKGPGAAPDLFSVLAHARNIRSRGRIASASG